MKVDKLQKVLEEKELDGCILYTDDPNFNYYVQKELKSGILFIPARGTPTTLVHPLEELDHDFNTLKIEDKDTVKNFFEKQDLDRVGYNSQEINVRKYHKLKNRFGLKDVSKELEEIRKLKTKEEIAYLRKAARIADDIMRNLINEFDFKTEGEIRKFVKMQMAQAGVEKSFEPVIAGGGGAAVPHYYGDNKLEEGFLIVDLGVKINGYCSDITRTFYLGKPNREERKLYEKVLDVQKGCIKKSRSGKKCSEVFEYAKEVLGENFTHGLGHGIGLRIHELPNLKPGSEEIFEDNMAFTVEPGYYDKEEKIGIRIEDDVLIQNGKPARISKTTRELRTFSIS